MINIQSLLATEPEGQLSTGDAALFIRMRDALRELAGALESACAEARSDFQRRLDAADAAIIQVIDGILQGGKATDVPLDVSAEWARVCRAIRINIVLRERAEKIAATYRSEIQRLVELELASERLKAGAVLARLAATRLWLDEKIAESDGIAREMVTFAAGLMKRIAEGA